MPQIVVCALYKFVALDDYTDLRQPLLQLMEVNGVKGTLLLASEGINGTIAGPRAGIDAVLAWLRSDSRLQDLECKESLAEVTPFNRAKVKLKKEIVTLGVEGVDPRKAAGTYIEPADWNRLISDPEVVVIDTRNDYEYQIGTFKNAINPNTGSFREFPQFVNDQLDPSRHKKVAMFCTGGIRCEKSTAYLKSQGFEEVYHLKGGILKYLEHVPPEDTLWQGECFVFDERVTVKHGLQQGEYELCRACRMPVSAQDKIDLRYLKGVSCPHCHGRHGAERLSRFREREKQISLARRRGEVHVGDEAARALPGKREAKRLRRQQSCEGRKQKDAG